MKSTAQNLFQNGIDENSIKQFEDILKQRGIPDVKVRELSDTLRSALPAKSTVPQNSVPNTTKPMQNTTQQIGTVEVDSPAPIEKVIKPVSAGLRVDAYVPFGPEDYAVMDPSTMTLDEKVDALETEDILNLLDRIGYSYPGEPRGELLFGLSDALEAGKLTEKDIDRVISTYEVNIRLPKQPRRGALCIEADESYVQQSINVDTRRGKDYVREAEKGPQDIPSYDPEDPEYTYTLVKKSRISYVLLKKNKHGTAIRSRWGNAKEIAEDIDYLLQYGDMPRGKEMWAKKTNLRVEAEEWIPADRIKEFNPDLYDFKWNEDYTMFIPIKLNWHDDLSYIEYQSRDVEAACHGSLRVKADVEADFEPATDLDAYEGDETWQFETDEPEGNEPLDIDFVRELGEQIGINWDEADFTPEDLQVGIEIEFEHGTENPDTNITDDDLEDTAKVAWRHLLESGNYYKEDIGLPNMEEELKEVARTARLFAEQQGDKHYKYAIEEDDLVASIKNSKIWPLLLSIARKAAAKKGGSISYAILFPDVLNFVQSRSTVFSKYVPGISNSPEDVQEIASILTGELLDDLMLNSFLTNVEGSDDSLSFITESDLRAYSEDPEKIEEAKKNIRTSAGIPIRPSEDLYMNVASLEDWYSGQPPVVIRKVKIIGGYDWDQYQRVSVEILEGPEKGRKVSSLSSGQCMTWDEVVERGYNEYYFGSATQPKKTEKKAKAYISLCPSCKSMQRVSLDKSTKCTICGDVIPPYKETHK